MKYIDLHTENQNNGLGTVKTPRDYTFKRKAEQHLKQLCQSSEDVEIGAARHMALYGQVGLDAFDNSGGYRTRRGYELLRGKSDGKGGYGGGPVGRLRVVVGDELELRRITFKQIPSLAHLESDPMVQFIQDMVDFAVAELEKYIDGPFCGSIEFGRASRKNHFHVFIKRGTCKLGVGKVISDEDLVQQAGYIAKPPYFDLEILIAYVTVKRVYGNVARRFFHHGLGNKRTRPITVAAIEKVLGFSLAPSENQQRAQTIRTLQRKKEGLALPPLPELQEATRRERLLILRLRRSWAEGRFKGHELALPGRRCPDVDKTLTAYLENRSKLAPGEVADLAEMATALGLHERQRAPRFKPVAVGGYWADGKFHPLKMYKSPAAIMRASK